MSSPTRFLRLLSLVLLGLSQAGAAHSALVPAEIAFVPGQLRNPRGVPLPIAEPLDPHGVYLFGEGQRRPTLITSRPEGAPTVAELSPDGKLVAFGYSVLRSLGTPPRRERVPWLVIATRKGVPLDSVSPGFAFAWSPAGDRVAVLSSSPPKEDLLVWQPVHHQRTTIRLPDGGWELNWASADTIITGVPTQMYQVQASTGTISPANHRAADLSPDRTYSLDPGSSLHFHVYKEAAGLEVTAGVRQELGPLRGGGQPRWVVAQRCRHLLAMTTCDSLDCSVKFIDVARLRRVFETGGILVGCSRDGRAVCVAQDDRLVFVRPDASGRWTAVKARALGRRSATLELSGETYGRRPVGTDTVEVEAGHDVTPGSAASAASFGKGSFRVVDIEADGRVVLDARPGLRMGGVVVGPANIDFWQRFVVSRDPVRVSTVSYDGGSAVYLRVLSGKGER